MSAPSCGIANIEGCGSVAHLELVRCTRDTGSWLVLTRMAISTPLRHFFPFYVILVVLTLENIHGPNFEYGEKHSHVDTIR